MELTRRQLLQAGGVAGAALLVPARVAAPARAVVPAGMTMFTEQLPTLGALGVIDATGGVSAAVRMVTTAHSFHSALSATPTFAYRGGNGTDNTYLGPVVVARQGVPFDLTVFNDLGRHPLAFAVDQALVPAGTNDGARPRASTHLHGGNTRPEFDGGPLDTFPPGASFPYRYGNTQEAANLWYHDHALGITRLNVYAGLASGYLIRNADDPGDGSRLPAPPYEVPLIIQDRMFNPDGTLAYPANPNPTTPRPWAPEFFGDVATVNGKAWPNLNVARGLYRFRVYNGSNARFYNLRFIGGGALRVLQIGTDGGLLDAPVRLTQLLLGPGERADVIVDFSGLRAGATVRLTNDAPTPFPDGPRATNRGGAPLPEIMRFRVDGTIPPFTTPLPASLRTTPITRLAGLPTAATRTMSFVEILDPAGAPLTALLNNRPFDAPDFGTTPIAADTLELWELVNTTGDAHPIHLHLVQFQVLNRQQFDAAGYLTAAYGPAPVPGTGAYPPPPVTPFLRGQTRPPAANEAGWKDTVVTMPGEVTRILVPFGAQIPGATGPMAVGSTFTGEYVWHCHILEHEDNDMMQRYLVT